MRGAWRGFGLWRRRGAPAVVRALAVVIVMLAASPVTAPFSSCQASALLAAPAGAARASTADLSIQPLADAGPVQQVSMAEEQSNDKVTFQSAVSVIGGPEASVRPLRSAPIVAGTTRGVAAVLRL